MPSIFAVRAITQKNNDEETRGKLEPGAAHQYTMMHFDTIFSDDFFLSNKIDEIRLSQIYLVKFIYMLYTSFISPKHPGQDWFIIHVKLGHSMDNGFIFKEINKN